MRRTLYPDPSALLAMAMLYYCYSGPCYRQPATWLSRCSMWSAGGLGKDLGRTESLAPDTVRLDTATSLNYRLIMS